MLEIMKGCSYISFCIYVTFVKHLSKLCDDLMRLETCTLFIKFVKID